MARLNKQDLAAKLVEAELFTYKKDAVAALETITAIITEEVVAGNKVALPGFGKFEAYTSTTSGKTSPKFRPSTGFKEATAK